MRKFISAVTSLCVAATMATAIAPATVSAADTSKTLSLKTWDEAYGEKSNNIKVDASSSDVTIPVGIYLTESTNDVVAMAIQCKVAVKGKTESEYTAAEKTALSGFTTKAYAPKDEYFSEAHTYADSVWGEFTSTLPIYFHSKQNGKTKAVENMGSYQVAAAAKQDSAHTAYAYYGMAWTEGTDAFPTDYTGTNSDDFPIAVFDVTIPAGTANGTYEVRFCNYNTDPAEHLNPSTLVQTEAGRYQTDAETDDGMDLGDWTNNLNLETLTITVGDEQAPETTTTTKAPVTTTTTSANPTPTTTTTKAPTSDAEIELELTVDDEVLDASSADTSTWFNYIVKNSNGNRILSFDNNFKIVKVNADGSYTDVTDGSIASTACEKGDALKIGSWAPNATGFSCNGTTLEADGSGQLAKDGNAIFYFEITAKKGAAAGTYRIVPNTKAVVLRQSKPSVEWLTNYTTDRDNFYAEFKIAGEEPKVTTTTTTAVSTSTTTTTKVTTTTTTSTTTTTVPPTTQPGDPLYGDTNCDNTVNVADVVLLNKWLNDNSSYAITDQGKLNADCYNPQGGADLTAEDSDAIINSIVGNVTLPVNK